MTRKHHLKQSRCSYCGRFFVPDYRVKSRQKSCKSKVCQSKRKKESQKKWLESNPGYFCGRYADTKEWRERHPKYQQEWRARKKREIQDKIPHKKPINTIRLVVPGKWFKGEIQDEIRFVRQCGCGSFIIGGMTQDKRRDSSFKDSSLQ